MEFIKDVIVAIRTIKAELGISPAQKVKALVHPASQEQAALLSANREYLFNLARLLELAIDPDMEAPKASAAQVVDGCQVIVPLAGLVNLADELARLDKELARLEKELVDAHKKLHNESFVSRAPVEVVRRERERVDRLMDARDKLAARRALFAEAGGGGQEKT